MALGIGVTSNEPETSANLPSGRLNLKGQQKPQYLIDAIEAHDMAYNQYCECVEKWSNDNSDENFRKLDNSVISWNESTKEMDAAFFRWNKEKKYV